MLDAVAGSAIANLDLTKVVLAVGSLGTAAYGLVDVTKGFGGGISNRGFGDIKKVVSKFISTGENDGTSALSLCSALSTLRANWLNGMALPDQKSIAKALIKLNLTNASARRMAAVAGVNGELLTSVAEKLASSAALTPQE